VYGTHVDVRRQGRHAHVLKLCQFQLLLRLQVLNYKSKIKYAVDRVWTPCDLDRRIARPMILSYCWPCELEEVSYIPPYQSFLSIYSDFKCTELA
jgi:hypothetical protein